MGLFRSKKPEPIPFDPSRQTLMIRKSICTGEMTAFIVDNADGTKRELFRVDGRAGLEELCRRAGVREEDIQIVY